MTLTMLKSKIHRATVTQAELEYVGSLTVDLDLMEAANMLAWERVQVLNLTNGSRLETYLIEGERGSKIICLNGPAAHLGKPGDVIIALTYAEMNEQEAKQHTPIIVHVDKDNNITEVVTEQEAN